MNIYAIHFQCCAVKSCDIKLSCSSDSREARNCSRVQFLKIQRKILYDDETQANLTEVVILNAVRMVVNGERLTCRLCTMYNE